ncbi:MAG: hypothetical protein EBY32_19690, partial [Proteobacteria bacterium]|nr:hypothetical protein [Pseudomonadota bacterium]
RGKRKIEVEEVTPGRWAPNRMMCDETRTGDFYKRGYLFYRLLLDARNSKIIGLSGTPLINFPEELGILANVLHGYITIVEGIVEQSGSEIQKQAVEVGKKHPFIDFINAKNDSGGTRVVMSLLPAGNIKIGNDVGIARIPAFPETDMYVNMYAAISDLFEGRQPAMEEIVGAIRGVYSPTEYVPFENIQRGIMGAFTKESPTKKEIIDAIAAVYAKSYDMPSILKSIENAFRAAGLAFKGPPMARSEPLLPPFGDDFKQSFVPNGTNIINKATLITRLTGVVSYYKGSSLELMPRVAKDEVVRVPFSDYAQRAYSFKRTTELKKEMEKKPGQTVDAVWAQIYELGDSGAANNYKMGSRQACNFTFPAEVPRPSPTDKKEQEEEAEAGVAPVELVALAADEAKEVAEATGTEEFPELNDEAEAEAVAAAEA